MTSKIVGLLMVLTLTAAACGAASADAEPEALSTGDDVASLSEGDGTDDDAEPAGEVDTEAQLLAFAECLRGEGFDIEDPTVDADGNVRLPRPTNAGGVQGQGPPEGFVEARDVCSEHLEGVELGFQGGDQTERQDQFLGFAACIRDNGYDIADPDFSEGGGRGFLQQVDRDDPAFQAAFESCEDILGGLGGGGGAGGGGN